MTKSKKFLSILLSLALLAGLLSTNAFAMQIFIKATDDSGKTITLEVEPTDTINTVKQKIEETDGTPSAQQILTYNGTELQNDKTLESYSIPKDSFLQLTIVTETVSEPYFSGAGTESDPYLIPDLATLEYFRDAVNSGETCEGKYFKLTADIDMSGTYGETTGTSWTPIGPSNEVQFKGTFNGNGHRVYGLYVTGGDDLGLFGWLGGTVENLGVFGTVSGGSFVGGICGRNYGTIASCYNACAVSASHIEAGGVCGENRGIVSNCYNIGVVTGGGYGYTGGVCGENSNGTITNCYNTGAVTGDNSYFVGGVCGENSYGTITNCYNTGVVTGSDHGSTGGVCGRNSNGTITNCYNTGVVTGGGYGYTGGVCGRNSNGTITNCYNTGAVTSGDGCSTGGVCGYNYYGTITDCYNTGSVTGGGNCYIGGVCGENTGTITNCYNTGSVTGGGNCYIGGVCGENTGTITNCYYNNDIYTPEDTTAGVTGKTTVAFTSGEVAWLLQDAQGEGAAQVWGQTVPAVNVDIDVYPVLTSEAAKKVYKVTFNVTDSTSDSGYKEHAAAYANYGGTVALPTAPTAAAGFAFYKWSRTNSADGAEFTAETPVTADITVYAVQQEQYGEESGAHTVNMIYGSEATLDLYKCVTYSTTTTAKGKFDYTIRSGNDTLGATVGGDMLIVPYTAPAGNYMLTIRATEKKPQITLMSANALSVEPVDFIVTVTVIQAGLTPSLTAENKVYDGTAAASGTVILDGAVNGETPEATANFTFADANAGTGKTVTASNITLTGDWGKNYKLLFTTDTTTAAITPKTVGLTWSGCDDLTYTGSPVNVTATATGLESGDVCSVTVTGGTGINAGSYTAEATGLSNPNYTLPDGAAQAYSIAKANASVTTVPAANDLTYNGQAQPLVTAGEASGGVMQYSLSPDGPFSTDIPAATDAGNYTVYYKVAGDANHNDTAAASVPVTIQPPPHVHDWATVWSKDESHHWHECTAAGCDVAENSGKEGYGEHTWDDGEVTTQPTCTEKGVMTYTCTVCTATKSEEIPATGHTEEIIPGRAATCTEPGFTEGKKCSVCGQVLTAQEEIPATGHTFGDYQHDEAGHWRVCGVCEAEAEKEAHVFDDDQDTTCDVCGYTRTVLPVEPDPVDPDPVEPDPVDPDPVEPDPAPSGARPRYVVTQTKSAQETNAVCPKDESCPIARFTDASATAWYHDGVHYCLENGLMVGMTGTTFEPETATSRAMLVTILWREAGSPVVNYALRYDDVEPDTWYTEAVRWATAQGIVNGYGNGAFGPNDPITREQLAVMFYRCEQLQGGGFTGNWMFLLDFTDRDQVSGWAYEAVCYMTMHGVMEGKEDKVLDPQGNATRAEAAAMLQRFCADGR